MLEYAMAHDWRGSIISRYRVPEKFPAPSDDDCAYGCCKAGDVGLYSEARR